MKIIELLAMVVDNYGDLVPGHHVHNHHHHFLLDVANRVVWDAKAFVWVMANRSE